MRNTSINYLYETVKRYPNKICVKDKEKELTFEKFFNYAMRIAKCISETSLVNEPVIVYLPKGVDAVVSFAAVILSGNIYVPIDTKAPLARTEKILKNIAPRKFITSIQFEKDVFLLGIDREIVVFLESIKDSIINESIEIMIEEFKQRTSKIIDLDPCYIIHTSGSTGFPKGVVISHRGVMDYIDWAISFLKINVYDIIGNQSPLFFDNSVLDIFLSWSTGAQLNLIPENIFSFPIKLIEYLENHNITFIFFVPSVLVNIANMKLLSPGRMPALKKVVFAGEVMPTKHLAYWQNNLPDKTYINLYGPTEITVDCAYFVVDRIYSPDEVLPIGYPRPNCGIIILNEDNETAKTGEIGEICVRGSCLALGYWNNREDSQKAFIKNPIQDKFCDQIYRTGDLAYVNEKGQIIFVGRKDNQIKHMGYRIELGEIELAATSLPFIRQCCALYDAVKTQIVLCYESENEISPELIRTQLALKLPSYMIPRRYIHFKEIPLNQNGKIDRKRLSDEIK